MCDRLSNTDRIVVAGFAVIDDTGMIIDACAKGTRGVTNTTILNRRYVVEWFTASFPDNTRMAAGCCAIVHDAGMVEAGPVEAPGGMTYATILVCRHMVD